MEVLLCAAPECIREKATKYHCSVHSTSYYNKYYKYKKIETELLPILSGLLDGNIEQLLHYYAQLKQAYDLRTEYRVMAFKKEYWDSGHEFRLEKLLTRMIEIEMELGKRFEEDVSTEDSSNIEPEEEQADAKDRELDTELERIRETNNTIIDEEKQWNEILPLLVIDRDKKRERHELLLKYCKNRCKCIFERQLEGLGKTWEHDSHAFTHLVFFYITIGARFCCMLDTLPNLKRGVIQNNWHFNKHRKTINLLSNIPLASLERVVSISTHIQKFDKYLIELIESAGEENTTIARIKAVIAGERESEQWPSTNLNLVLIRAYIGTQKHFCLTYKYPVRLDLCTCSCAVHYVRDIPTDEYCLMRNCIQDNWYQDIIKAVQSTKKRKNKK